jgi:DNA-binding XRE family transcriptional regulator
MAFDIDAFRERLKVYEAENAQRVRDAVERRARGEKPRPTPVQRDNRNRELDRLRSIVAEDLRAHPLRRLRLAEDLTMSELAVKAKVSPRTVVRIELRESVPAQATMRKLAKALRCGVEDITP